MWRARLQSLRRGQDGFSLLETLIALGIVAVISVTFLSGLDTASKNTNLYEQHVTAANLVQSQVEKIRADAYRADGNYPVGITLPQGYSFSISTIQLGVNKQEITVAITKDNRPLFKLTVIKTDWA